MHVRIEPTADDACSFIRERLDADCAILIVLGGKYGNTLSADGDADDIALLPDVLEALARRIREDRGGSG